MLFIVMDAVDVAFTEAAVGAGISTVLLLLTIKPFDEPARKVSWPSATSILVGLGLGVLLIFGTLDMPFYGDPLAPVHAHLAPRFLGDSANEIGIPNVVTSVLASYRGYDTLGEVVVIFTAGIAVFILLAQHKPQNQSEPGKPAGRPQYLSDRAILKSAFLRLIPLVILFALYVQFHGDYGPGGGFQAGVIFGAGLITLGLLSGSGQLLRIMSERSIIIGSAIGVLLYAGVGVVSMIKGGNFLDYSVLADTQTAGQHIGILVIELGVGVAVAFTMISLFVSFTRNDH